MIVWNGVPTQSRTQLIPKYLKMLKRVMNEGAHRLSKPIPTDLPRIEALTCPALCLSTPIISLMPRDASHEGKLGRYTARVLQVVPTVEVCSSAGGRERPDATDFVITPSDWTEQQAHTKDEGEGTNEGREALRTKRERPEQEERKDDERIAAQESARAGE